MSGTKAGAVKAKQTIVDKFGSGYWAKIGSEGGKRGTTGGYWYKKYVMDDTEAIRQAGSKGGKLGGKSRHSTKRKPAPQPVEKSNWYQRLLRRSQ